MSNPIIAPQLAQANANSPKLANAHALPADAKVSGKNIKEIKAEAATAAEEFASTLKEGLDKEAKKDEAKDAHSAQVLGAQAKPVLIPELKTDSKVKDLSQKANLVVNPLAGAQGVQSTPQVTQAQKTSLNEMPEQNVKATLMPKSLKTLGLNPDDAQTETLVKDEVSGKAVKADVQPKASSLSPLQEMLLTQAAAQPGAQMQAAHAQALKATEGSDPEFSHAFEIESLGVAATPNKSELFSDQLGGDEKRTPSSKVSTSDFLSLRDLTKQNVVNPLGQSQGEARMDLGTAIKSKDGKKDKLESLGGKEAFTGMMSAHTTHEPNVKSLNAEVTTGSAGKTVMTHDAIHEMSKQVNLLSQARQDGEIKIRLRPDHLGELHMSVKTQGQQVSIEFKAQNSESKKIIEESLASLKDSLAGQNLTLARVDVVQATTQTQTAADQGTQFDMSQFRQNSGQQNSGREFQQGQRQDQAYEDLSAPVNLSSVRRQNVSVRGGQGLDLIA